MKIVLISDSAIVDELAVNKMKRIDQEISSGKRRVMSEKEALGKYSKQLRK